MFETSLLLADFKILIRSEYPDVVEFCRDYVCIPALTDETADLVICPTEAEIEEERNHSLPFMAAGYLETICIYRAICRRLPLLGGMMLHAAVLSDAGRGYAFTANSGTGKTTHLRMWTQAFGDAVAIINGDKPILRKKDGVWHAYGTPWCGKEGWNINTAVPLCAICFLRRGETNAIAPYDTEDAIPAFMPQLLLPDEPEALMATLDLLEDLVSHVPLYELHCTINEEAARVARACLSASVKQNAVTTKKNI